MVVLAVRTGSGVDMDDENDGVRGGVGDGLRH